MATTPQIAYRAIQQACDDCATRTSLFQGTALVQPKTFQSEALRLATSATAVPDLIASGIGVMKDDVNYVQGVTETQEVESYAVGGVTASTAKSVYGCTFTPMDIVTQSYNIHKHVNRIDGEHEKCLKELRGATFEGVSYQNADGSINETAAQAYFTNTMVKDLVKKVNSSLAFGQFQAPILGTGGAAFDGLFKKTKLAAENSYTETITFTFKPGGVTYVQDGALPLFFATGLELAAHLAQLTSAEVASHLAYTVGYDGDTGVLTVASRLPTTPILGVFRIFSGDVTNTLCAQTADIEPKVIQNMMPTMAQPLVTAYDSSTTVSAMTKLENFIAACFAHGVTIRKSFGSSQSLVVLYDPQMFLNIKLKEAFTACCQNNNNRTASEAAAAFMVDANISFVPFTAFEGTNLFWATTPGNVEVLTAGQKDASAGMATFEYKSTDCNTHIIQYEAYFGLFIKDTSLVCTNAGGHPLYEKLDGATTNDRPECNIATCAAVQSNCIATIANKFQTASKNEAAVCNGVLAVKVKDTTNYGTNAHNGTKFVLTYFDGLAMQTVTKQTVAGTKDVLFVLNDTDVAQLVVVTANDVVGNVYVENSQAVTNVGDCDDLAQVCIARKPSETVDGNSQNEIDRIIADYQNYNTVIAEWISYDSDLNLAYYTVYIFGNTVPVAVNNDVVTSGACV